MKQITVIFIFLALSINQLYPQYGGKRFLINFNANYTTTAKIYLNPYSTDIDVKNRSLGVEDIFSPSLDIRYRITDDIILGLNSEYMKSSVDADMAAVGPTGTVLIHGKEGYNLIPVEVTLFYLLPFSTEYFKFQMGGGAGYYFGSRFKEFGDASVGIVKGDLAFGVHVITSCDFLINDFLSVRGEMKFRDPEFELRSMYENTMINYKGVELRIPKKEFDSKVNVDGITFTFGVGISF
jgi:hypothetical protein